MFHLIEEAYENGRGITYYGPFGDDGKMDYAHRFKRMMERERNRIFSKYGTDPQGRGLTMAGLEMAVETGGAGTLPLQLQPGFADVIQLRLRLMGDIPQMAWSFRTFEWNVKTASPAAHAAYDAGAGAITETPQIPLDADTVVGMKLTPVGKISGVSISNLTERVAQQGFAAFLQDGRRKEIDIAIEKDMLNGLGTLGSFKGGKQLWDTITLNKSGAALDILDIEAIQDLFILNNPEGAASPNLGITDQVTWRKIAAWRDPYVVLGRNEEQGVNPEENTIVKGITWRPSPWMPQSGGSRQAHIITPSSLRLVNIIPPTMAEYGPLTTARVWAWQWWGMFADLSANDAGNKDGSGGVANGNIYGIA